MKHEETTQGVEAAGVTGWLAWVLCLAVLAGEVGAGWWFRSRASRDLLETYPEVLRWLPPGEPLAWRELPVMPEQVAGLTFDRGRRYRFHGDNGLSLDVLYLDFDAGHEAYAYDLLSHPPQYCLGMAGWQVVEVQPDRVVTVAGEPIRVQSLTARSSKGEIVYVFKGIWIHSRFGFNGHLSREARVRLALQPMPPPPSCIFVIGVAGPVNVGEAWENFIRLGLDGFRRLPSRLNQDQTARVVPVGKN